MKNLLNILPIIFIVFIFSCGIDKEDEKELVLFYEDNFQFIEKQKHLFRHQLEKSLAVGGYFNLSRKSLYKNMIQIDSSSQILIKQIDSCIKSNNFKETDRIFNEYNSLLNKIDSIVENDKNYVVRRFDLNQSEFSSELKFLRIKNDLVLATTNCVDYTYIYLNASCGFYSLGDITTSSIQDSNGATIITLSSESLRPSNRNRNLIIEDLVLNDNIKIKDFSVNDNNAFTDIKYQSLISGEYSFKGKIRYYTKKGIKDYPFEHQFKVE